MISTGHVGSAEREAISAPGFEAGVPAELVDATWRGPVHQVAPGRVLVSVPGLARALIRSGAGVALEVKPGVDPLDLRWLMERPVSEASELLTGRFALRAATVVVGGRAVALAGGGAAGKSTVAAALAIRGHGVLGDHHLQLDVDDESVAQPHGEQLELWPDAAQTLGLDRDRGQVVRPALSKRAHPFPTGDAAPLALVVILDREADVGSPRSTPVLGGDTLGCLFAATAVNVLLEPLDLRPAHFAWMVRLATDSDVVRLEIDRDRADPQEAADAIEELVG